MAQNQNINIKATVTVDSKGVDQYNDKLQETEKLVEQAFNPKKQLREATLELQRAQAQFGEYSKEAIAAARRVADLRDGIQAATETAALFDPGAKFKAYSNALQSAASAFAGVQGAIGLLGVESKEVEQQLLRVQSALAFSEGLSTIGDIGKNFKELSVVIRSQVVGAFNALKAAIGSTGIGLLVIALGTIVANWDKIKATITGVSEEQKKLNADTEANVKAQQKKLDSIDGQEEILKEQGLSEREILLLKQKQTAEVIAATEAQIQNSETTLKLQIEAEKRNKAILKGIIDALVIPSQIIIDLLSKAAALFGKKFEFDVGEFASSFVFDPEKITEEGEAAIQAQRDALTKLKNDRARINNQIRAEDEAAAKEAAEKLKAQQEADAAAEDERIRELNKRQFKIINEEFENQQKERQRIREAIINDETAVLTAGADAQLKIIGEAAAKRKAIEEQTAKDKLALDETQRQSDELNRQSLQATGDAFGILADIIGRQTAAGKALAIAQSLINTYQGITQIWANKTVLPEPAGTIQKVAATVTAGLSGFAAVRGIVRTQVPGGGGGGANVPAGAGGAAPIAPAAAVPIQTTLDQGTINQIGNVTSRAYVVESDVSDSQERIRRINRAARFG